MVRYVKVCENAHILQILMHNKQGDLLDLFQIIWQLPRCHALAGPATV